MAFNTVVLLKDKLGTKIPQFFDSIADVFKAVSDLNPLPVSLDGGGAYIDDTGLILAAGEKVLFSDFYGLVHKFGENEASAVDTRLPVWSQSVAYPFPTAAVITHISQQVDQVALRGQTIEVQGLDINYDPVLQNVTLDAVDTTTLVAMTTPLLRISRKKILANVVGTQVVVSTNAAGTTVYSGIPIGYNQTMMAIYTVPAGKTSYLTQYYADVLEDPSATKDPDATEIILWFADRANGYEFQAKHERGIVKGSSGFLQPFKQYYKITEKTDIMLTAQCSGRIGHIHAGFDLILINN